MKHCPWCYEPAVAATWTPRHGWINLCQHHYNVTSRDVVGFLLEKLHSAGQTQESVRIGGARMRELEAS